MVHALMHRPAITVVTLRSIRSSAMPTAAAMFPPGWFRRMTVLMSLPFTSSRYLMQSSTPSSVECR